MIRRFASARSRVATVAIIMIIAAGCDAASSPSEPESRPTYEQVPRDLCYRVDFEEIVERFGLTVPPWYERDSNYATYRNHWYESCWFSAKVKDGRFEAKIDGGRGDAERFTFAPRGPVGVEVFHEVADARDAYEQESRGPLAFQEDGEPRAITEELTGWWDSGVSLTWFRELAPRSVTQPDPPPNLMVMHLVRHENLVVQAIANVSPAPTEDVDGALELLHDLLEALIDEAVDHLTVID